MKYIVVDDDVFLDVYAEGVHFAKQQLFYDRCFNRIVDNSKILELSGMKQSELMRLKDGLARELENATVETVGCNDEVNARMDKYLESMGIAD